MSGRASQGGGGAREGGAGGWPAKFTASNDAAPAPLS